MGATPRRVVLDTNILVRGLVNLRSDSGLILRACETRHMVPLLSQELISEYRYILTEPELVARYPKLKPTAVKIAVERLIYLGDVVHTGRVRFEFPRDPKDEKLLVLAIAGEATELITTDLDLLDLPHGRNDAAKRFRQRLPSTGVLRPDAFIAQFGTALGIERSTGTE
ncbi:MAG: putative toxin-antitoxin system toxin component, PIN family [Phycisphaeraceae bacterium]|nr:putative toxin-antitoxin system toxin component, PIN family [Phycisphaeraceae bacterium]